jgi:hypothetical protein
VKNGSRPVARDIKRRAPQANLPDCFAVTKGIVSDKGLKTLFKLILKSKTS